MEKTARCTRVIAAPYEEQVGLEDCVFELSEPWFGYDHILVGERHPEEGSYIFAEGCDQHGECASKTVKLNVGMTEVGTWVGVRVNTNLDFRWMLSHLGYRDLDEDDE